MKKYYWASFLAVIVIATIVRFYKLGEVPAGMTWDEAAIGYNGFAIRETGRDEWLKILPISFQSFGDYKAPFAIYLNGFFTLLLGMNLWSVRFPFAFTGVMAVVGLGLLSKELWASYAPKSYFSPEAASVLGMSLLALSPWHIHFSRVGFESGLALAEIIWATYFLHIYFVTPLKSKVLNYCLLLLSALGLALSLYTYHSAKIVTPLLGLTLLWYLWTYLKPKLHSVFSASIIATLFLLPLLYDSFFASGAERLSQTSLLALHLPITTLLMRMISNYFSHFSLDFLIFGQVDTLRHGSGVWGVFLPTTFILIFSSIVLQFKNNLGQRKVFWLSLAWALIGLLPAAIGQDAPHSNRALMALPGFILLAVQGAELLLAKLQATSLNQRVRGNHDEKNIVVKLAIGYFILLQLACFLLYQRHYYAVFAKDSTPAFQAGYLEVLEKVVALEKDDTAGIEKILFSNEYGQPYIYTLFTRRTNPFWYHGGSLIKYEFADIKSGDILRPNTIVVASLQDEKELPFVEADSLIYGPDGSIRFALFVNKKQ